MPTRTSGNVYGDLTGSIFEPQVKSIANVATGTLAVARGGTGLTSVGTSGSALVSNGSSFVYATVAGAGGSLSAAEVSGALNALTSSISASYMQKSGGTFTGAVTASAGTSASFYRLADGAQLSSSTQLGTISASNPSVGDLYAYISTTNITYPFSASATEIAILSSSDPSDSDGYSDSGVRINSSGTRIFIGAPFDETGSVSNALGVIYVYDSSSSGWSLTKKITSTLPNVGFSYYYDDGFDINDTGDLLVVGAGYSNSIQIFNSSSSGWNFQQALSPHNGGVVYVNGAGNKFAYGNGGLGGAGTVKIFTSSSSGWTLETIITGTLSGSDDFGTDLAFNSSFDKAAISAYGLTVNGTASVGLVYIYNSSSNGWTVEQTLTGTYSRGGGYYGLSLDLNISGNLLAVGAIRDNLTGTYVSGSDTNSGIVYIYRSGSYGWYEEKLLAALQRQADYVSPEGFGKSVHMKKTGDYLLIGANFHYIGYYPIGLSYVFRSSSLDWELEYILSSSLSTPINSSGEFGHSVNASDDFKNIVIGTAQFRLSASAPPAGLAFIYNYTPAQQQVSTTSSWSASKSLSGSYALSGTLQFVPQNTLPTGATGQFAVSGTSLYFYDGSSWRAVTLI